MARPAQKAPARILSGPDADEVEALAIAASELKRLCPAASNAEAVTAAVISKWIIERTKRAAALRGLGDAVVFDLDNAKLRGVIEAALPQIGGALADIPPDVALFALSKDQVVQVFSIGCIAAREVALKMDEASDFPFDDPIPFGD